jgi:DNA repair protein RadA/Sms
VAEPAGRAARTASRRWPSSQPVATLSEIEAADVARTPTGQDELDRVLGGGIVEGGVVLIGGDPGIGKSTLLLQAVDALSHADEGAVRHRRGKRRAGGAARAPAGPGGRRCGCWPRSSWSASRPRWRPRQPAFCVIDSIQTRLFRPAQSAPGSVAQVRECAAQLTRTAKPAAAPSCWSATSPRKARWPARACWSTSSTRCCTSRATPHSSFRLVRAIKNRFGAVNEIGVFAMTERA